MKPLKPLPKKYLEETEKKGTITRIDYETALGSDGKKTAKYAYVYLPYGYDKSKRYDILYCLHGGGGEIEVYFGSEEHPAEVKRTLDSMIANGDIPPMIAVSPTYYSQPFDHDLSSAVAEIENFCSNELISDLIPAVENAYSTYAQTTDKEGLKKSRNHRAYAGYSMGALSTWYTLLTCLDYFSFFMPMSGDCWTDGQSNAEEAAKRLENVCEQSGCQKNDLFVYAVTGDKDIAYEKMKAQIEAMEKKSPFFQFITENSGKGNICFQVEPDATHDYKYMPLYFYNALPVFFGALPAQPHS